MGFLKNWKQAPKNQNNISYRFYDDWMGESTARKLTKENRLRVARGEAYCNDNEEHSPILRVIK